MSVYVVLPQITAGVSTVNTAAEEVILQLKDTDYPDKNKPAIIGALREVTQHGAKVQVLEVVRDEGGRVPEPYGRILKVTGVNEIPNLPRRHIVVANLAAALAAS